MDNTEKTVNQEVETETEDIVEENQPEYVVETESEEKAEPEKEEGGFFKKRKLAKQVEELTEKLSQVEGELAAAKNDYYRAYADAANMKKRYQADAEQAAKYRIQSFALNILPAIDALEMALNGKDVTDPFVKGVKLTYDKIMNALSQEGVSEVECLNKPFDANTCHAIMTEKVEGVETDVVVEVLQKGYMLKDRLLRAALVKVSE